MRDLKELQAELEKYNGKDISIRFEGSLRAFMIIENARCMATYKTLLIGNMEKDNQEFQIDLDEVTDIEIGIEIVLYVNGNYRIYIYNK